MAKQTNGFAGFPYATGDFAKVWGEFKVPSFDIDVFVSSQRKNMETLAAVNQLATENFQAIAKRQAELLQETATEMQAAYQDVLAAGPANERAAKQIDATKAAFDKALANAKELQALFSKSTSDTLDVVNKRVAEGCEEVKSAMAAFKN